MSVCQPIYRIFWRIAISTALSACLIAASGCSNSTKSAMAKGALAQSQFEAGQIWEARQTITKAIAERDDIVELQLLHARIDLAAKSPANAFTAYSNALSLDSSNVEALLGVSQLGLQIGYLRESEDAADRILTLDPRQQDALIIKGLHNVIKHHYADTLANADAILANAPTSEGGLILKARALALLNRSDEALTVVENARKASGDSRGVGMTLLELYRQRGDGPAMVAELERLRKSSANDYSLDIDEANTLYKLSDIPRARAILRHLIFDQKLDDAGAIAVTSLWKEYDPAPLDTNALAEFAAKTGMPARKAVARYFLDRNDPIHANAALLGAPPIDDIVALRAQISIAQGKLDEGLGQARAILQRDQTHCDALVAKAQVDVARGRADDAITASQVAVSSCPQLITANLVLARAHKIRGSREGVGIAFRDGFERNSQDSDLTRAYTAWLEQTGQGTRALAIARRLTNNAPALLSGWKLYLEICAKVPGSNCTTEAEAGLAVARRRFGVDPRQGERQSNGLFGRLNRK